MLQRACSPAYFSVLTAEEDFSFSCGRCSGDNKCGSGGGGVEGGSGGGGEDGGGEGNVGS